MCTRSTLLAIFAALVPACAYAAPPDNVLFAGTIARQYLAQGTSSWCLFEGTNSTFISKSTQKIRLISFPDIIIAPNGSLSPTAYTVGGQARLTFSPSIANAGTIEFIPVAGNPPDVNTAIFKKYGETYNAATNTLTVAFRIYFPTCSIPVSATYRN